MVSQERIDALNARLTQADVDAIASDWRAVGDDLRAAMDEELAMLPDDPNHPYLWGRPWVLSPEAAVEARAMIEAEPEPWLARILAKFGRGS